MKLNSKLNLDTSAKKTVLDTNDIVAIIKFMLDLRDGKGDVDDIHEYLLLKGVEAVSIHRGKEQAERNEDPLSVSMGLQIGDSYFL